MVDLQFIGKEFRVPLLRIPMLHDRVIISLGRNILSLEWSTIVKDTGSDPKCKHGTKAGFNYQEADEYHHDVERNPSGWRRLCRYQPAPMEYVSVHLAGTFLSSNPGSHSTLPMAYAIGKGCQQDTAPRHNRDSYFPVLR